jgi:hypothetical protein
MAAAAAAGAGGAAGAGHLITSISHAEVRCCTKQSYNSWHTWCYVACMLGTTLCLSGLTDERPGATLTVTCALLCGAHACPAGT